MIYMSTYFLIFSEEKHDPKIYIGVSPHNTLSDMYFIEIMITIKCCIC